jgi:hypothetical protein
VIVFMVPVVGQCWWDTDFGIGGRTVIVYSACVVGKRYNASGIVLVLLASGTMVVV